MRGSDPPTTVEAFTRLWAQECGEWMDIRKEMLLRGESPSAHDVSLEQRKRMLARGEVSVIESAFARVVLGAPPHAANDEAREAR